MVDDYYDGRGYVTATSSCVGVAWSVPKNAATEVKSDGDSIFIIPLEKAMPMKVSPCAAKPRESPCAAKPRDPWLLSIYEKEKRMVAKELAAMAVEDTLACVMQLKIPRPLPFPAKLKIPRPLSFPPPGFVGPGPGAPPKKSCGPPPLNVPPATSVGPTPLSGPPTPGVYAAWKPCKFIPAPGDDAGMQLRKLKDRHNERESKRRARRAREAEARLNLEQSSGSQSQPSVSSAPLHVFEETGCAKQA